MVTRIGLDLGYANITLSDSLAEIYREPAVALVHKEPKADSRRTISIGSAALDAGADGANVPDGVLVRPFKNGLLFDSTLTEGIIAGAVKTVQPTDAIRCVIGVPSDLLPKQEKALFGMLEGAGVGECFSVNRAIAALVGAGYSPTMSVISVNVGASATEVAVLHGGSIVLSTREKVGGEDFDKAVKQYILEQGDVNVSLSVARAIKERLGSVWKGRPPESIDIEGTLSLTGNRVRMTVASEDVVGVFEKPLHKLLMAVADTVKKMPLELVEPVFKNGIVLTGGGALLFGLGTMMERVLGIPVTVPDDAIDCVAKGLSRINTFIPMRTRQNNKNITSQVAKFYESKKSAK